MTDFVTVEGRALREAMKIAASVIERRNTIPILNYVRLSLNNDGLRITGTDLDVEATASLDVIDGAGDWHMCLDAQVLSGVASAAGAMDVKIERNGEAATITLGHGTAVYETNTLPAGDFPDMSHKRTDLIESFTNGMLAATLDKVKFCISTEETRYYLNGVCWQMSDKGRRFVATDGHRLALCRYSNDADENGDRIIPRKTVELISKHLAGKDVSLFATDKETAIDIVAPGVTFRTKLIDGTFPNIDRVIPQLKNDNYVFAFNRTEIITAIHQASVIGGSTKWDGRAIKFYNDNDRVAIERKNPDFGTAKVKTSTEWPERKPEPFAFNSRYLREVAMSCQGEVSLRMTSPSDPFLITDEDTTMTRVLMPMRA